MKNYKKLYEDLSKEFEQYKKESVKWSVEDFLSLEVEGFRINQEQAQEALERMIQKHDAGLGISWDTLEYYYEEYGTKDESVTYI